MAHPAWGGSLVHPTAPADPASRRRCPLQQLRAALGVQLRRLSGWGADKSLDVTVAAPDPTEAEAIPKLVTAKPKAPRKARQQSTAAPAAPVVVQQVVEPTLSPWWCLCWPWLPFPSRRSSGRLVAGVGWHGCP